MVGVGRRQDAEADQLQEAGVDDARAGATGGPPLPRLTGSRLVGVCHRGDADEVRRPVADALASVVTVHALMLRRESSAVAWYTAARAGRVALARRWPRQPSGRRSRPRSSTASTRSAPPSARSRRRAVRHQEIRRRLTCSCVQAVVAVRPDCQRHRGSGPQSRRAAGRRCPARPRRSAASCAASPPPGSCLRRTGTVAACRAVSAVAGGQEPGEGLVERRAGTPRGRSRSTSARRRAP